VKVAIIHPRFLALGGAERVVEALAAVYPGADIFVLSSSPEAVPSSLRGRKIHTCFLSEIPWVREVFEKTTILYPLAVKSWDLSGYDLVISSAGPAVFGVKVSQSSLHICYCHTPERMWWDQYASRRRALRSLPKRLLFSARTKYIRRWEYAAAHKVDYFVANSHYISQRIERYFGRKSTVIYPSVDTTQGYLSDEHGDYFLTVGRLVPAKRTELLVQACTQNEWPLVVVGAGPEEHRLKSLAGPTVKFLGYVPDPELRVLYAKCRAFLFAADEDFGIAMVEVQSFGRPVIAFGHGGSLETVRVGDPDGKPDTGVFFSEQTVESVVDAILRFQKRESSFDPVQIQLHARKFDTAVFMDGMRHFVDTALAHRNEKQ
jgi:glycosyltransferase involved in cell wall biosynthesis